MPMPALLVDVAKVRALPDLKPLQQHPDVAQVAAYLVRTGYLAAGHEKDTTLSGQLLDALVRFQRRYRLPSVGHINAATRDFVTQPQCGMPDSQVAFATVGAWTRRNLTYAFGTLTNQVTNTATIAAIQRAFQTWQAVSGSALTFQQVQQNQNPDILIEWRLASDPDLNMTGGILAHADFPPGFRVIGDNVNALPLPLHFDESETWVDGAVANSFDIESVAVHEIGHCLGLAHSAVTEAVMFRSANANGTKRVLDADDLGGIRTLYPNEGPQFVLQTGTCLHEVDDTFEFLLAINDDLFAIKKRNTGTSSTEIHVLSAAATYQSFAQQTGTALHETDDSFQFLLAANRDVFAIKKNGTGTGSTEIHVLSAASGYQQFSLHTGTSLHETSDDFEFLIAPNRDIFAIKKNATGTGTTEIHVLSAASNYQSFILQTGTCLHETDNTFQFGMAPNRDIYAFKKKNTGTNSTEIHVLASNSNYQCFSLQTGSELHETDADFEFEVSRSRDVIVIKKRNTGTNSTEVHRLDV